MALFNECMQSCAHIVLDTADIVREAILRQSLRPWQAPNSRDVTQVTDITRSIV